MFFLEIHGKIPLWDFLFPGQMFKNVKDFFIELKKKKKSKNITKNNKTKPTTKPHKKKTKQKPKQTKQTLKKTN